MKAAGPRILPASEAAGMGLSYRIGWMVFRAVLATYFRARYYHPERVPLAGPAILAANHASYIDPPLVGSGLTRRLAYLARDTLFRFPLIGALLRSWNAVPVDRDGGGATGLRMIMEQLAAGEAVLLFPEGTRSRDGRLSAARSGIGLVVIKSSAPVIPVRVFGTYEAYGRHHWIPRAKPVAVKYGEALTFDALRAEAKTCSKPRLKEIYQEVAEAIMEAIGRLEIP